MYRLQVSIPINENDKDNTGVLFALCDVITQSIDEHPFDSGYGYGYRDMTFGIYKHDDVIKASKTIGVILSNYGYKVVEKLKDVDLDNPKFEELIDKTEALVVIEKAD